MGMRTGVAPPRGMCQLFIVSDTHAAAEPARVEVLYEESRSCAQDRLSGGAGGALFTGRLSVRPTLRCVCLTPPSCLQVTGGLSSRG